MTTLSTFENHGDLGAESTRDLPPAGGSAGPGGLTLPVLGLAALIASPAIWQCVMLHTVTTQVMLERYVVIALGCLLVSEGVRRLLRPAPRTAPTADGSADTGGIEAAGAPADTLLMPTSARPTDGVDPALSLLGAQE